MAAAGNVLLHIYSHKMHIHTVKFLKNLIFFKKLLHF